MAGQRRDIPALIQQQARDLGVLRPRDLAALGIAPVYLARLERAGGIERVARGLYMLPDHEPTEHHTLVEVCRRVPRGVVCLLSALSFHDIGTQQPFQVWLALPAKAWAPHITDLPLRVVRFSGPALREGVTEYTIEGVHVRVYDPAKTVADCFKYRNKVGLDVALEALRDVRRRRMATMDELRRYAVICRVGEVMRPYLESIT